MSRIAQGLFALCAPGRLSILNFHSVPRDRHPLSPGELTLDAFEARLRQLRTFLTFLPLAEAVVRLRAGRLPRGAACITFDDGYAGWMDGVVPILQSLGLPATFFITTGQFEGHLLWNERLRAAISGAPEGVAALQLPQLDAGVHRLDGLPQRRATLERLEQLLKYRLPDEREALLRVVESHCGASTGNAVGGTTLSADEVRTLASLGFEIGAHTVNHPILAQCDPDTSRREIAQSREELQALIGAPVAGFAYPNGRPGLDYGPEHVRMVREAGFRYAVTTGGGMATHASDPMELPRFTPWGPGHVRTYVQMLRNARVPAKAPDPAAMTVPARRAMLVAFHFPPQAGSSGMLRTLNFTKYLPAADWSTTVLTAGPAAYERTALDLVPDIPTGCGLLRAGALDAARHLSIRGKYLGFLASPDRWVSWLPGAWRRGTACIRAAGTGQGAYRVVWSTYPIATAHLIGGLVARSSGLPWIADFRDPMTTDQYPAAGLRRRAMLAVERFTVTHARRCVFTTSSAAQTYARRYPEAAGRMVVIENGYDEEAFQAVRPSRPGVAADELLLLHSGGIYPKDRDPSALFLAAGRLVEQGRLDRRRLRIRFRASGHDDYVRELAERHGVADLVELAPPVPYAEALAEMLGADLLLLFQGAQFNTQIPAKIYEYLRAGRPILGLLDPAGQTARVLARYEAVQMADILDVPEVAAALGRWLDERAADGLPAALERNMLEVRANSRQTHAAALGRLFDEVIDEAHAPIVPCA